MFDLTAVDGESGRPNEEFMAALMERALLCVSHVEQYGIAESAAEARRIRHCLWGGQHWTERRWDSKEGAAYPFDGASDFRYRLSDFLVNQRVAESFNALMRGQVQFGAVGEGMVAEARWCAKAWKDLRQRRMPMEWMIQNLLVANYLHGSGRGVAGMWTGWKEEQELRQTRLVRDEVLAIWMGHRLESAGESAEVSTLGFEAADEKELAAMLLEMRLCRSRVEARDAGRDLLGYGRCDVVEPRVVVARPEMRAMALGDTFWLPPDAPVGNMDDAADFHVTEWYDAAEVRSVAARERWHKDFRDALLEAIGTGLSAGDAVFPFYDALESGGDMQVARAETELMRGKVQVVRSYLKASGEDGMVGRFTVVWSGSGKGLSGRGVRLVRSRSGGWPVQLYASEVVGAFALDSRGVPQLAAGMQAHGKMCHESLANVSMLQLPPIKTRGLRDEGQFMIEPLGEVALRPGGEVEFMKPPAVPMATIRYLETLDGWRDLYFGVPSEKGPQQVWQNAQALRVAFFLGQSAETTRRLLAEDVGHRAAEDLPEGLRGDAAMLPVQVRCDPREWDMEYVKKVAELVGTLLMPMDKHGVVRSTPLVQSLMLAAMPEHADAIGVDEQTAQEEELKDEQQSYLLLRAGIRPEMKAEGNYDFEARLGFYARLREANPLVFDDLPPDRRQLLSEHLKALEMGVMQQENVQVGRTGVKEEVGAMREV